MTGQTTPETPCLSIKHTHFADRVLREPVVSMSPARNSWYLVQAMLDVRVCYTKSSEKTVN